MNAFEATILTTNVQHLHLLYYWDTQRDFDSLRLMIQLALRCTIGLSEVSSLISIVKASFN